MSVWKKLDVQGDLQPIVAKARGKVADIYDIYSEDLFITSQREGKHGMISLHPDGWAFDFKKAKYNMAKILDTIRQELGPDFDVVEESNHIHVEYDPK